MVNRLIALTADLFDDFRQMIDIQDDQGVPIPLQTRATVSRVVLTLLAISP